MKIDDILRTAVEKKASDIFISVGVPPTIKVNNTLEKIGEEKLMPDHIQSSPQLSKLSSF